MSNGVIQITGVPTTPGTNGSVPLRREVRDLQQNAPDQFNLFILGIRAFQQQDEEAVTSYYQISGIHGMPFKPWDGVQGISDWQFGGYCTHSSVLFAPWHRPYVALFEQTLYTVIQGIAQQFPSSMQSRYTAAAQTFRLPYFDWASSPPAGSSAFPTLLSSSTISVVDVDGTTKQIANPLYQFAFHPVNPQAGDFDQQWSAYPNTVRYPTSSGKSQDSRVTQVLANENGSLRSNVSLLLLSYTDFDAFTNNQWLGDQQQGTFGSLEDVHNEIHDKVGGNGHMGALEVAAFDPVFWLHHCNVDRLWAIWQDLNPGSFITPQPAPTSTFSTEQGTVESADSPLTPFWDNSGTNTFWTSTGVIDSTTFGYAYPETQKWQYSSADQYQQALRQAVTSLYGGNVFSNFEQSLVARTQAVAAPAPARKSALHALAAAAARGVSKKTAATEPIVHIAAVTAEEAQSTPVHDIHVEGEGESQQTIAKANPAPAHAPAHAPTSGKGPIPASLAYLAPNNKYNEWIVNIRALKHGLGQTFRIMVFLGDIHTNNPDDWDIEPNCVGRVSVLSQSSATCSKCRSDKENELVVTGTVPLTSALLQDIVGGRLQSLEPAHVVPHLQQNLKLKVRLFSGEEKQLADVPGLKVSVCSTTVTIGADGIPNYSGAYVLHPEATQALPAGITAATE